MSGYSINDEIESPPVPSMEETAVSEQPKATFNFNFLKSPTGEGNIEDYLNHPLNFSNSKGLARVIRGLTGLFGNLDLAIIDIFIGLMDMMKKTPMRNDANVHVRGVNPIS